MWFESTERHLFQCLVLVAYFNILHIYNNTSKMGHFMVNKLCFKDPEDTKN